MSQQVEGTVESLAWMLLGAALVGMLARRVRLPYVVALVLGGVVVEETRLVALPQLEPNVLLFVFLPPLLFDAAFRLDERELRAAMRAVLVLALPGTVATALVVAVLVVVALGMPPTVAFLFGSVVAATDPVGVVAVFRTLNVPTRLSVVAEAESLINDGVAITLYTVAIGLVTSGATDVSAAVTLFVRQVVGGVLIGAVLGALFSRATATIDDHLIEMTLSTALAYGSFLIGQAVETSGALACVAAGLIHGSYGRHSGMSERTQRVLDDLWEYFGFVANALVFLLVGFSVNLRLVLATAGPVAVAIVAVIVSRIVVVLVPPLIIPPGLRLLSPAARVVLVWGGLRGALTITLALAVPQELRERQLLIAMAFGVVLFTLLLQGLTLPIVVRRAGLGNVT